MIKQLNSRQQIKEWYMKERYMKEYRNIKKKINIQLNNWRLFLTHPSEFVDQAYEEEINWVQFVFLIIWWGIINFDKFLDGNILIAVVRFFISVMLMTIYFLLLVSIGGGKRKLKVIFNLAIYIHFFYVLLNATYNGGMPMVVVYVIAHAYTMFVHYNCLIKWLECSRERMKIVLITEISVVALGFVNTLLICAGEYMMYSSKMFYYPLIG